MATHPPPEAPVRVLARVIRSSMEPAIIYLPFGGPRSRWEGPERGGEVPGCHLPDHQIASGGGTGGAPRASPGAGLGKRRAQKRGFAGGGRAPRPAGVREKKKS